LRHFGFDFSEGDILPANRAIGAQASVTKRFARALLAPALVYVGFATNSTESAVANGDTRTINLSNSRTNESGAFTYMVNGSYDSAVLEKLNWFLRDWRANKSTKMDPHTIDLVWEIHQELGSKLPIHFVSGYRSPGTNEALRKAGGFTVEGEAQHLVSKKTGFAKLHQICDTTAEASRWPADGEGHVGEARGNHRPRANQSRETA